jgi:hypothetical protein
MLTQKLAELLVLGRIVYLSRRVKFGKLCPKSFWFASVWNIATKLLDISSGLFPVFTTRLRKQEAYFVPGQWFVDLWDSSDKDLLRSNPDRSRIYTS